MHLCAFLQGKKQSFRNQIHDRKQSNRNFRMPEKSDITICGMQERLRIGVLIHERNDFFFLLILKHIFLHPKKTAFHFSSSLENDVVN